MRPASPHAPAAHHRNYVIRRFLEETGNWPPARRLTLAEASHLRDALQINRRQLGQRMLQMRRDALYESRKP